MAGVTGAVIGSAVIGAGSSIYGAKKAASAAKKGQKKAAKALEAGYQRQLGIGQPTSELGAKATATIADLYGYGKTSQADAMKQFYFSPGYDFRLKQGLRALDLSAASAGGLFSGAAGKAALGFGEGLAADEYGRWLSGLYRLSDQGQESDYFSRDAAMRAAGANAGNIMQRYATQGDAAMAGAAGVNEAIQGGIANYLYASGRGLTGMRLPGTTAPARQSSYKTTNAGIVPYRRLYA